MKYMNQSELSKWFEKKYLEWQMDHGRASLTKFAKYLGISKGYLSQILNGEVITIGMKSAVFVSEKLNDYSLLDILNYPRPESDSIPLDSLPPDLRERLRSALLEIEATLKERSIQPDSPAGAVISASVLQKFGFIINSMEKG